jgi:hypothetical protein
VVVDRRKEDRARPAARLARFSGSAFSLRHQDLDLHFYGRTYITIPFSRQTPTTSLRVGEMILGTPSP